LAELSAAPPPTKIVRADIEYVDAWQLTGTLPDAAGHVFHEPSSSWDRLLAEVSVHRQGRAFPSEAMHCVARETGAFFLAKRALPDDELQRFIDSRCGMLSPDVVTAYRVADVIGAIRDERLFDEWHARVRETLEQLLPDDKPRCIGLWFGRSDGRVVVMMAVSPRRADVEPIPYLPDGSGRVVVRGQLLIPAARIEALVNHGAFGFRECVIDRTVALPSFAVECQTDAGDPSAWLEVAAFAPGRITGHIVVSLEVWPAGAVAASFARPVESALPADSGSVDEQLLAGLNRVRAQAGLAPLTLAPAESQTATKLAPHYFAAVAGSEPETVSDLVVLGLRAGWQVPGTVRFGDFAASLVRDDRPSRLVAAALARPSGRRALLDASVERLALGAVTQEAAFGAVMGTYALFHDDAHANDVHAIIRRLATERRARRLAEPGVLVQLQARAGEAARSVQTGGAPKRALAQLLEDSVGVLGQSVNGWVLEGTTLDSLPIPEELLRLPGIAVTLGVAHYRPAGEPWARYVVLIVVARTASI
jgi:hypothetical protein